MKLITFAVSNEESKNRFIGSKLIYELFLDHCWEKVKEETEIMKEAIDKEFHLNPVTEGVVVVYQGEKENKPEEWWKVSFVKIIKSQNLTCSIFLKGKRIVELPKKRPSFFGYNLLEPSTQGTSDSKEIAKPEDLA